jgi:hydroxypyruvate isomerase
MSAHRSVERFETSHHGGGEFGTPGFARQAALVVAVMAALLALATFLSNEAVKEVITGETGRADTSSRLESNQLKIDVAAGNATMLKVLAQGPHDEAEAAVAAAAHERRIAKELAPADHRLVEEIHHNEEHVDHYNDKHLLYELAEVGLEVGIVLATVSIIARRRWLLASGAAVGAIGTVLLVAGALTV